MKHVLLARVYGAYFLAYFLHSGALIKLWSMRGVAKYG